MNSRIRSFILAIATLLLYIPLYAQDEHILSRADSLHQQGSILVSEGDFEDAIVLFKEAAEIRRIQLGDNSADLAKSLNSIGASYYNLEDYAKSLEYYQQALTIREKTKATESLDYAMDCFYVGICHLYLGDVDNALSRFLQALPILEKEPECDKDDYLGCIENIGYCYEEIGDPSKALKYYQQALESTKIIYGDDHPRYAEFLDRIGSGYFSFGDYTTAQEFFEHALLIWESKYGKESPDCAMSFYNIGNCLRGLEDYENALDYYQRALEIFESAYGKENEYYYMCVGNIASGFFTLGNYDKAIEYYKELLTCAVSSNGDEKLYYLAGLNGIGICYAKIADYEKALEFLLSALEVGTSINDKVNPDNAMCLNNIGTCYSNLSNYDKALEYHQQALDMYDSLFGKEDSRYALSLSNIADCYRALSDYNKALELNKQALIIREKSLGKENSDFATSLSNIGSCYYELGNYTDALMFHQEALSIREMVYSKNHPDYSSSLHSIGVSYFRLGNTLKALEYLQQALEIDEKIFGKEHPAYADILNSIGLCYGALGEYTKALEYLQQALSVRKIVLGEKHLSYSHSLNNIGLCYCYLGEFTKALDYYLRALNVYGEVLSKDHPECARTLNNIGDVYRKLNDQVNALKYYQQALEIRNEKLGKINFDYNSTLYSIIWSCYYLNDYSRAQACLTEWFDNSSQIVLSLFSVLPEGQRGLFWKKYQGIYTNELYDLATRLRFPLCRSIAYDGTLLGKGLLLNAETEMRKLILESGDEEALQMYNEIQESRIRLDKIYEDPVGKKELIDSLNNDIEVRQQELMKRSKVFGDYTRNLALKWTDVQSALGKKDIAIEFETYTHKDTTFYIALTLRPGYTEPHLVELFNSTQMKAKSDSKKYYTSTAMSKLIWGNLSEELNGVKNVYFSPAGELNNIGIEYMLDEGGEHLLSEKRNYYRLTSTRELAKEHQAKKMSDATVYGGIRYDVTPGSKLTGEETESERLALSATRLYTPADSLSVTRGGWNYLPGTKDEAESISSTLTLKRVKNELLEGEAGTEESFKALGGARKDVIHIATHGFYWTETEAGRSGMETSSFMLDVESKAPKEDKALTRSGLLFAGAQNAFEGKDIPIDVEDGILTAKDISRMDLRGTDLVVISACQSGLGEVTGDGVFGLQRGFKKAGVQSIVMSLWEVDDNATKIMMTRFYENLAKGKSKFDSFREAQNYLRKYDGGLYDEPEYYAAFVLLDSIK